MTLPAAALDLSQFSNMEMATTLMQSALRGNYSGRFGTVGSAFGKPPGTWRLDLANGRGTYFARRVGGRWQVGRNAFTAEDTDLESAFYMLCEAEARDGH